MPPFDLVGAFLRPLNATGVSYMVTGSVAATIYGEPRLTQDVDLVLHFGQHDVARLRSAFPEDQYYVPPPEALAEESARTSGGHFNLLHHDTGFRADCYLAGSKPLNLWGLANRRAVAVGTDQVWIAPPEYVIVAKLEFFRAGGGEKHLIDIANMLRVSGETVDRSEISRWVRRLDLSEAWDAAQARGHR